MYACAHVCAWYASSTAQHHMAAFQHDPKHVWQWDSSQRKSLCHTGLSVTHSPIFCPESSASYAAVMHEALVLAS